MKEQRQICARLQVNNAADRRSSLSPCEERVGRELADGMATHWPPDLVGTARCAVRGHRSAMSLPASGFRNTRLHAQFLLAFVCAVILFCGTSAKAQSNHSGYLHASGVAMLDNSNNPIVLRSVNLGNWLWPEYYMMDSLSMPAYANAGTGTGGINNYYDGLVAAIQDLMNGDTNLTAQLLDAYWTNFISAQDIAFLHSQGFNGVRVPFDFEEFFQVTNWANNYPNNGYDINTGFKYFDNLLNWCASNQIYVIPDFHCPPGGPNNFSVTNYGGTANTNTASVFASAPNLALTEHIWSRIAARYATNRWLGGYDLLNEPVNTSFGGQVGSPTLANTFSNL